MLCDRDDLEGEIMKDVMKTKCTVEYNDGRPSVEYPSIQSAAVALLNEYPDGVIYDAGQFDHDADDADYTYDVRAGRAALACATVVESVEDDGSSAVAEIVVSTTEF